MRVSALTPKSGRAASPPTTLQVPAWAKVRAWGVLFSFAAVLALCGTPANPAARSRPARDEPTYGGRRWWFMCPLAFMAGAPPRRVAKLYLPPGGRYFGSREAYRLTYTSCQESGKYDGLYRRLAANMGTVAASIRLALKRL